MHREGTLYANGERELADCEGLSIAGTMTADDDALDRLNALPGALNDLVHDLDGVTDPEFGQVVTQLLLLDSANLIHETFLFSLWCVSGCHEARVSSIAKRLRTGNARSQIR